MCNQNSIGTISVEISKPSKSKPEFETISFTGNLINIAKNKQGSPQYFFNINENEDDNEDNNEDTNSIKIPQSPQELPKGSFLKYRINNGDVIQPHAWEISRTDKFYILTIFPNKAKIFTSKS